MKKNDTLAVMWLINSIMFLLSFVFSFFVPDTMVTIWIPRVLVLILVVDCFFLYAFNKED